MKNEIKVPSMGESILEVTVGQILVHSGSVIKADAEILELETDKVNQVLYASHPGKVSLTVKSGDTVKIGQSIGWIESVDEMKAKEIKPESEPEKKQVEIVQDLFKIDSIKFIKKESLKEDQSEGKATRLTKEDFLLDLASFPTGGSSSEINKEVILSKNREGGSRKRNSISHVKNSQSNCPSFG